MNTPEPIAVVGAGLRLPGGARTPDGFADFLRAGGSGVGPFPADRWDVDRFRSETPDDRGTIRTTGGGFLDRIDEFDAAFFNISPAEADHIDPQQRMLLETAWEALEDARIDPATLRGGNGGVYVGASSIDYALELEDLAYEDLDSHLASGITMFPLSGRLSYVLGWHGPSISIDSACSSSLAALHAAMSGLRGGECDVALVGGVNAIHHPRVTVMFSHAGMLSPDAQCKTFDDAADGYVRAEACVLLVCKTLTKAQADGDEILGLVRGTAVGQDGDSAGLTVPNGVAQERVMRAALAGCGVAPADVQYVEAHGTGTPLGDPIEMSAIGGVFADSHDPAEPLLVGSVKTNLGHTEPASGIVGLLKALLALRAGTVFPHLNLNRRSDRIPWARLPVDVPTEVRDWPDVPVRRAVVNSFGFAGTIAAAVVEQAPAPTGSRGPSSGDRPVPVLTLSAKTPGALRGQAENLRALLADRPDLDLLTVAAAAAADRSHFPRRLAAPVEDHAAALAFLDDVLAAPPRTGRPPALRKVAMLFSGQGSQYEGMGAAAYRDLPVFRAVVDECDALFAPWLDRSVRDLLVGASEPGELDRTINTQPALFTLEYAFARQWMAWGVRPSVVMGHSIGEVVAATVAEVLDLPDAVRLVACRARAMNAVTRSGGMAAVAADPAAVTHLLGEDLALAAVNAPGQCVISGATEALAAAVEALRADGVRVTPLTVSHAFHSPLMREVYDRFRADIAPITFHEAQITVVSNLTGRAVRGADLRTAEHWVEHIGAPVLFADGVAAVARRGRHAFLEVGPASSLLSLARAGVEAENHAWFASAGKRDVEGRTVLRSLAGLYTSGVSVAWADYHGPVDTHGVRLPTYAFERRRHWLPRRAAAPAAPGVHPLLGAADPGPAASRGFTATWPATEDAGPVGLGTWIELLLAAQDAVFGHARCPLEDVAVHAQLALAEPVVVRTRVLPDGAVEVVSGPEADEVLHLTARFGPETSSVPVPPVRTGSPGDPGDLLVDVELARPAVRATAATIRGWGAVGGVTVADLGPRNAEGLTSLPPDVVDAALVAGSAGTPSGAVLTASGVGSVRWYRRPRGAVLTVSATAGAGGIDLVVDDGSAVVVELRGVRPVTTPVDGPTQMLHARAWVTTAEAPAAPASTARRVAVLGDDPVATTLRRVARGEGLPAVAVPDVAALADARRGAEPPTDIVWCWRRGPGPRGDASWIREECERNVRDLLELLAALRADPGTDAPRLWLVSRGAVEPDDGSVAAAGLPASMLWGLGHVLLNDSPQWRPTLVDVTAAEVDLGVLVAEMRAPESGEFAVLARDGVRHVRRLRPVQEPATGGLATPPQLDPERSYLVTGGLGGLGLAAATTLADLGARHLVLVSRSGRATPDAEATLAALRDRAGLEVRIARADVSVPGAVERLVREAAAAGRPVGGAVHAAGEVGSVFLPDLTWEDVDRQLAARAYGGWHLHRALAASPGNPFLVMYSTIAAVVGGVAVTQGHYAASASFLDGLGSHRRGQGAHAAVAAWGAWARLGMTARLTDELHSGIRSSGVGFLSPGRAEGVLAAMVDEPVDRLVGPVDWTAFAATRPVVNRFYDELPRTLTTQHEDAVEVDLRAVDAAARRPAVEAVVRDCAARTLGMRSVDDLDPGAEFVALGLDSVMAVGFRAALQRASGLALPVSLIFDHPTPEDVAAFIDRGLAAEADAGATVSDPAAA